MIIGVDLGSKQVKTSAKIMFDNRYTQKEELYSSAHKIEIDGQVYYIGEGDYETETNKIDRPNLITSLYSAIALSTTDEINQIVLGLPVQHYKSQKSKLVELVKENRIRQIRLDDGDERQIMITDVEVAPEGVTAFYSLDEDLKKRIGSQDLVIIDIGGRTTDICLYKLEKNGSRRITKYESVMVGILNIYSSLVEQINEKYVLDYDIEDAQSILQNGLYLHGVKQDISFTGAILVKQVNKIFKTLNMNFSVDSRQPLLMGGGGLTLKALFKEKMPHTFIANEPLFGNSIGFLKVGETLWNK